MPELEKRYRDLSPIARTFLEQMTPDDVMVFLKMQRLVQELPDDAVRFLCRASPETLKWLEGARPEEIDQLNEGLQLVRSVRTVGRFMKWAILTAAAVFGAMFLLAENIQKMFKGGGH